MPWDKPRQRHRIENSEDTTPPYSKPKESGTTGLSGPTIFQESFHVPFVLWHSVIQFSMIFICLQRDCCTKEGSSRVLEGLAEDYPGTEAVPLFAKAKNLFV